MYCPVCGTKNKNEAKFCIKCGSKLSHEATDKKGHVKQKNHKNTWIIVVIIGILAVGLAIFIGYNFIGDSNITGNAEQIKYDNGDYLYKSTEENIAFDEESGALYFNDMLMAYTLDNLSDSEAELLAENIEGELVGRINGSINALQIRIEESNLSVLREKAEILMQNEEVLYAAHDFPIELSESSEDNNPWSEDGTVISDKNSASPNGNDWWAEAIGAYRAWEKSDDVQPIKVGILDNGFDLKHPDLQFNISLLNSYPINSKSEHGTHVAGIVGAVNNEEGIRGIADSATLVCVDWSPTSNINYLSNGEYIEITKQFIEDGVKVINNSWAMPFYSEDGYRRDEVYGKTNNSFIYLLEYLAIRYSGAYESYLNYMEMHKQSTAMTCMVMIIELMLNGNDDFLIVEGAGNGIDNARGAGIDAENSCFYCAMNEETYNLIKQETREKLSNKGVSYESIRDHVMIVGAVENITDDNGNYKMWNSSNYGSAVDICAPGGDIFSTLPDETYGETSGTSMAAPMVTGSAALLWSLKPELAAKDIKDILIKHTNHQAYGVGDAEGELYPMLNIGDAISYIYKEESDLILKEGVYRYIDGDFLSELRVTDGGDNKQCYWGEWYNYGESASIEDFEFVWTEGKYDYEVIGWRSKEKLKLNIDVRENSIVVTIVNTEGILYSNQRNANNEFKAEYEYCGTGQNYSMD